MLSLPSLTAVLALAILGAESQETFTNPILEASSADPAVIYFNGSYYMSLSTSETSGIRILRSPILTDFNSAEEKLIYTIEPGYYGLWAPEIHFFNGEFYVYFCMDTGEEVLKRSYAIKAKTQDPLGEWEPNAVRLMPDLDDFAIDGTLMVHGNGKQYFVYAGIKTGTSLFIAELIDPMTIGESRLLLRRPTLPFETDGTPTVEGAYFFYNNSMSFMAFSGGSTWTPNYSMGIMSVAYDKDPMNPNNWWYGPDDHIFWKNEEEGVYTTGHASFVLSPDGTETWMVYHGTDVMEDVIDHRIARLERLDWDENGMPIFPRPHGRNSSMPVPSGQLKI